MTEKKNKIAFGKKSEKHFLHYVRGKCKKHGVSLKLKPVTYIKVDGIRCSGYFDDSERVMVVAMKNKLALEILVHEFCHLTQFIDNCPPWKNIGDSLDKLTKWLEGKRVNNIHKHINAIRDMELDNEKRTVEMIKLFNLDISIKDYIKRANSYIYFYNWIKKSRRWSNPKNSPYKNENVLRIMPDRFQKSYTKTPLKIEKIYEKENI